MDEEGAAEDETFRAEDVEDDVDGAEEEVEAPRLFDIFHKVEVRREREKSVGWE